MINSIGTQHDPADGTPDPTDPDTGEHDQPDDDQGDQPDDDQPDQGGNSNSEARKYRLRLRETERERDQLRDTLERTRRSVVDHAVTAAGLDPRLLTAAGHSTESFIGEDGLIDHAALTSAITKTAEEFKVNRPRLTPNPQQGTGGAPPRRTSSWSEALKAR